MEKRPPKKPSEKKTHSNKDKVIFTKIDTELAEPTSSDYQINCELNTPTNNRPSQIWIYVRYLYVLLIIIGLTAIFLIPAGGKGSSLFDITKYTFTVSLGSFETNILFYTIFGIIIFTLILFFVSFVINLGLPIPVNKWFLVNLFVMFALFLLGMQFIDTSLGVRTVHEWKLQNSLHQEVGRMNCFSNITSEKTILVNDTAICKFDLAAPQELNNVSTTVQITYEDGSKETIKRAVTGSNYELSFRTQQSINYLYFILQGTDSNNQIYNADVAYPVTFLTKEELNKKRETFLSYLLGLLAIIFVTTPLAMNEFKKLWRDAN